MLCQIIKVKFYQPTLVIPVKSTNSNIKCRSFSKNKLLFKLFLEYVSWDLAITVEGIFEKFTYFVTFQLEN